MWNHFFLSPLDDDYDETDDTAMDTSTERSTNPSFLHFPSGNISILVERKRSEPPLQKVASKPPETTQANKNETPPIQEGLMRELIVEKVKSFFPEYTPEGILRFSSLLQSGKLSSMPKRKPPEERIDPNDWTFDFAPPPSADMLDDDTVGFLAPVDSAHTPGKVGRVSIVVDEMTSEWRFGPAKYWYDLFGFSEDGKGFDYGFRMKVHIHVHVIKECTCVIPCLIMYWGIIYIH